MSEEIEVVGHLLPSWFFDGDTTVLEDADIYVSDDLADMPVIGSMKGHHQIELMTVYQHNRIVEQKNQRIEHLESAWHADVIEGKDAAIAKQEAENDRLKAELEQYKRDAGRIREALEAISFAAVDMMVPRSAIRTAALNALSAQPDHSADKLEMVKPVITSEGQLVELLNNVTGLHEQCVAFTAADVWAQLVKQQAEVKP